MADAHGTPQAGPNNATPATSYNEPPDVPAAECGQAAQGSPVGPSLWATAHQKLLLLPCQVGKKQLVHYSLLAVLLKEQLPLSKRQRVAPSSPDENRAANTASNTDHRRHSTDSMAAVPGSTLTVPSPDMVSPVPLVYPPSLTSPHQINEVNQL